MKTQKPAGYFVKLLLHHSILNDKTFSQIEYGIPKILQKLVKYISRL